MIGHQVLGQKYFIPPLQLYSFFGIQIINFTGLRWNFFEVFRYLHESISELTDSRKPNALWQIIFKKIMNMHFSPGGNYIFKPLSNTWSQIFREGILMLWGDSSRGRTLNSSLPQWHIVYSMTICLMTDSS